MSVKISNIIFLSDMDGTLLTHDKRLSEEDAEAIVRFREAGGTFAVATGRVIQATRHYFDTIGLNSPVILCNGGMIYDCAKNKVAWSEYLPCREAKSMVRELIKNFPQACAEICTPEVIYDYNINDFERHHWKIGGFTATPVNVLDDIPMMNWCKILFAMPEDTVADFAEYCNKLPEAKSVEFITSSKNYHEMLPKGCTKGDALLRLKKMYGGKNTVVVAMGDYNNDMTMLKNADFSACPANALETVKDICDMICLYDCDHGAVAEVLDYIMDGGIR